MIINFRGSEHIAINTDNVSYFTSESNSISDETCFIVAVLPSGVQKSVLKAKSRNYATHILDHICEAISQDCKVIEIGGSYE